MIHFILYKNGNLRYGADLAKLRAGVSPAEEELEAHTVDNPAEAAQPAPVVVPVTEPEVQP